MSKLERPYQLIIEMTNVCNLRCKFCYRNTDSTSMGYITEDLFYSIMNKVDCNVSVTPWINGEPTLHPKFHEFAKYMNEKNQKYCVTTNGKEWKEETFQAITNEDSSCYQIMFSIDGLYNKSNDTIREGSDLDETKESLNRFIKLKKEKKSKIDIGLKIVNKGQDYEEIEDFIYNWLISEGIDYVSYARLMSPDGSPKIRHYPCKALSDGGSLSIRYDGSLLRCCYNEDAMNERDTYMGNIQEYDSILKAFNSKKLIKLREDEKNNIYTHPCDTCAIAYCGNGFYGKVTFRDEEKRKNVPYIYWHSDSFQEFYSLKDSRDIEKIFPHQ